MKFTKKKIAFTGLAIGIICGAVLITQWDAIFGSDGQLVQESQNPEADDDNDGLLNWEEELWRTDPTNPDTDGDNVSDGDEVAQNRHPRIAGPGDELEDRQIEMIYEQSSGGNETNRTDAAWEAMAPYLASYLSVPEDQRNVSEAELRNITENIAENATASSSIRTYTQSDISVINASEFPQIDTYFQNLTETIAAQERDSNIGDELLIYAQAANGATIAEDQLVNLDLIAADYRTLAQDLADIDVPAQLSQLHIDLLNNFQELAQSTEDMSAAVDDPVRSMVGIRNYRAIINRQEEILNALGERIGTISRELLSS